MANGHPGDEFLREAYHQLHKGLKSPTRPCRSLGFAAGYGVREWRSRLRRAIVVPGVDNATVVTGTNATAAVRQVVACWAND